MRFLEFAETCYQKRSVPFAANLPTSFQEYVDVHD